MTRHLVYRPNALTPIGSVHAPGHPEALVLAETLFGGPVHVQRDSVFPVPAEAAADMADRETVATAAIMRQVRRAA